MNERMRSHGVKSICKNAQAFQTDIQDVIKLKEKCEAGEQNASISYDGNSEPSTGGASCPNAGTGQHTDDLEVLGPSAFYHG